MSNKSNSMLEHQKKVLNGVSYNRYLFKKELLKSIGWLNSHEIIELRKWIQYHFYDKHPDVINEVFDKKTLQISN